MVINPVVIKAGGTFGMIGCYSQHMQSNFSETVSLPVIYDSQHTSRMDRNFRITPPSWKNLVNLTDEPAADATNRKFTTAQYVSALSRVSRSRG